MNAIQALAYMADEHPDDPKAAAGIAIHRTAGDAWQCLIKRNDRRLAFSVGIGEFPAEAFMKAATDHFDGPAKTAPVVEPAAPAAVPEPPRTRSRVRVEPTETPIARTRTRVRK